MPGLGKGTVQIVQMIGVEILQLDMADCGVDSGGQLLISDDSAVLDAALLLQINYIIAVRSELLAAVRSDSFPALLLKGRGERPVFVKQC